MAGITEAMEAVLATGKEVFFPCRDEGHAASVRVMAFNTKRSMPRSLSEEVGVQRVVENGRWFVRIYPRDLAETQLWQRNPSTGQLEPIENSGMVYDEKKRMEKLMRQDGKSEEEIQAALKE